MAIGDKLHNIRTRAGYSMRGMARLLGMSHASGYQYWETGEGSRKDHLKPDLIESLLPLVGMGDPPIRIEEIAELSPQVRLGANVETVPVVSWVQAGEMAEVVDPYALGQGSKTVRVENVPSTCLALEVRGTSMNRVAPEGSLIIVDYADRELINGRYYVVKVGDEATFKRYRAHPPRLEPDSYEPHETIFLDGLPAYVVGRVIHVQREL